jgi:hypothetical protein
MTDQAAKWGSQGGIKSVTSWKSSIDSIKSFNDERAANVFTALGKIASGGTAKLTVTATPAADGDIYIEGVKMSEGMAGMTFFKGISLALKAVPKKGCTFTSWGGAAAGSADSVNIPLSADQTITATFAGTPSSVKPSAIRENPSLYCHDRAVAVNCAIALTVDFSFAAGDHAVINLYNLSGKKIAGLFDSDMSRGVRTISLTSKKLPAGVYFYAIKTNAFTRTNLVTVR